MVPVVAASRESARSLRVSTTYPPRAGFGEMGKSRLAPDLVLIRKTGSWTRSVTYANGEPSTGSTSEGCCRQNVVEGFAARSGGNTLGSTAGKLKTSTDIGFWKDGGLLSFKFNSPRRGRARAGMY